MSAAPGARVERVRQHAQVLVVAGAGRQVDVEVGRDALERVVARAVQRERERVRVRPEDLRGAVALVDVAVDDQHAPHQPLGAQPRHRHRDVVEQAVAAGEVAARVVGAAAEVHPDAVLQRPPRRGQRPADRPPPALDQHLRPRQPEPALLAHASSSPSRIRSSSGAS